MGNQQVNMKFLVLFAVVACASAQTLATYPNGAVAPAKTPEVQAAEAAHFAAKGIYAPYYGFPYGGLVAHPNGAVVPVDAPDVAAAKAAHFAAHGLPVAPVQPLAYAAGYPGLVAHPNGALVPVEPADVQAARADHLAAHA